MSMSCDGGLVAMAVSGKGHPSMLPMCVCVYGSC